MSTNLPEATGYFAISLPEKLFWQGFYIRPLRQQYTDGLLATLREMCADAPIRKTSMSKWVAPSVAVEDRKVFQAILASMCDLAGQGSIGALTTLAVLAADLAHARYFVVEGLQERGRTATTFERLNATSIEQAQRLVRRKFARFGTNTGG